MNEDEEAIWVGIHAKVCASLPFRVLTGKMLLLNEEQMKLLREQMPKLLKVNQHCQWESTPEEVQEAIEYLLTKKENRK